MRNRIKVLALMVLVCGSVWGQNKIGSTGDVGIGTIDPQQTLHIQGTPWTGIRIQDITKNGGRGILNKYLDGNNDGWEMFFAGHSLGQSLNFRSVDKGISGIYTLTMLDNGNVGIGTSSPASIFDIVKDADRVMSKIHVKKAHVGCEGGYFDVNMGPYNGYAGGMRAYVPTGQPGIDRVYLGLYTSTYENEGVQSRVERLTITDKGNVGIGTTNPGDYKLAVEGIIGAHEIKVTTDGWADFVFDENYALPQLQQVEEYIQENKHLPNIPSEQEVLKEGIALGEMDAKLLQKIEELTLYTISQEKKLDQKDKEVQELKEARRQMEERLQKLEALLLKDK